MGKTRKLAEDLREEEVRQEKNLEETNATRTMQLRGMTLEAFNAVQGYLETRPHKEVANLIQVLAGSPVINATVIDDKKD
jgi:hypothetical protein